MRKFKVDFMSKDDCESLFVIQIIFAVFAFIVYISSFLGLHYACIYIIVTNIIREMFDIDTSTAIFEFGFYICVAVGIYKRFLKTENK